MCWGLLRLHFLNKEMLGEQFRKFTAVDIANRVKHVILPLFKFEVKVTVHFISQVTVSPQLSVLTFYLKLEQCLINL